MAKKYLCDCCDSPISSGRIGGNLAPFHDLCKECYQGFINLSKVVKLSDKDILKKLDNIVRASHANRPRGR